MEIGKHTHKLYDNILSREHKYSVYVKIKKKKMKSMSLIIIIIERLCTMLRTFMHLKAVQH